MDPRHPQEVSQGLLAPLYSFSWDGLAALVRLFGELPAAFADGPGVACG
jgi:hypothetical protein